MYSMYSEKGLNFISKSRIRIEMLHLEDKPDLVVGCK